MNAPRVSKVVVIGAIDLNLHQWLHQIRLHLYKPLLVLAGGGDRLYAITRCQEQENSADVITGTIKVFTFYVYALLDPRASLSFVTPYAANQFDILPEKHYEPLCDCTLVGESILAESVYHDFLISINHKNTMDDLV